MNPVRQTIFFRWAILLFCMLNASATVHAQLPPDIEAARLYKRLADAQTKKEHADIAKLYDALFHNTHFKPEAGDHFYYALSLYRAKRYEEAKTRITLYLTEHDPMDAQALDLYNDIEKRMKMAITHEKMVRCEEVFVRRFNAHYFSCIASDSEELDGVTLGVGDNPINYFDFMHEAGCTQWYGSMEGIRSMKSRDKFFYFCNTPHLKTYTAFNPPPEVQANRKEYLCEERAVFDYSSCMEED